MDSETPNSNNNYDTRDSQGNGYLRQGEFRRWAQNVDFLLRNLSDRVGIHGEILAVLRDHKEQGDKRRNTVGAIIAAVVAAVVSAVLQHWH